MVDFQPRIYVNAVQQALCNLEQEIITRGGNKGSTASSVGSSSDSISSYKESNTITSDLRSSNGDVTSGNEGDTDAGTTSLEK
eukprot:10616458-Ditylum_brightwellii.AAC.1